MGPMTTQKPVIAGAMPQTHHIDTHHLVSTAWIPRAVRCRHCGELAHEDVRERLNDEEVAVRYSCSHCRSRQTRHYHETEMDLDESYAAA